MQMGLRLAMHYYLITGDYGYHSVGTDMSRIDLLAISVSPRRVTNDYCPESLLGETKDGETMELLV